AFRVPPSCCQCSTSTCSATGFATPSTLAWARADAPRSTAERAFSGVPPDSGRKLHSMVILRALAAGLIAVTMLTATAHPYLIDAPQPAGPQPRDGLQRVSRAGADDAQRGAQPDARANAAPPPARTPDDVLASLNRAMSWYRQARLVMNSVEGTGVFG